MKVKTLHDTSVIQAERKIHKLDCYLLAVLLLLSAYLYGTHLTEVPDELNSYGTQAMITAQRLLHGQVSIKSLILLREMTQEECGYSLPFVLWNALFQIVCGGMTVFAARLGSAVATWLSCVLLCRIAFRLQGSTFALLTTAVYAFLPITIFNARSESIFAFSVLLLLIVVEGAYYFIDQPTKTRGFIFGCLLPLLGYGIANIRLQIISIVFVLLWGLKQKASLPKLILPLLFIVLPVGCFLIPQINNFTEVKRQMSGRGEHIFGGVLKDFVKNDPTHRTAFEIAKEQLSENLNFIVKDTFSLGYQNISTLPLIISIPMVLGLIICIFTIGSFSSFFMLLFWSIAYVAPLIAIPASWVRMMMFTPMQSLVIALFWYKLYQLLSSRGYKAFCTFLCLAILLPYPLYVSSKFLRNDFAFAKLKNVLTKKAVGKVVFVPEHTETGLNYLRWSGSLFGRDLSHAISIVGMQVENRADMQRLITAYDIPSVIIVGDDFANDSQWIVHTPQDTSTQFKMYAFDLQQFNESMSVFTGGLGMLSYHSPMLYLKRLQPEPLHVSVHIPSAINNAALLLRLVSRSEATISITHDQHFATELKVPNTGEEIQTRWVPIGPIEQGDRDFSYTIEPGQDVFLEDMVVLGR